MATFTTSGVFIPARRSLAIGSIQLDAASGFTLVPVTADPDDGLEFRADLSTIEYKGAANELYRVAVTGVDLVDIAEGIRLTFASTVFEDLTNTTDSIVGVCLYVTGTNRLISYHKFTTAFTPTDGSSLTVIPGANGALEVT